MPINLFILILPQKVRTIFPQNITAVFPENA
jgi:hypothetical protein